ncbi:Multiple epidermal growth factor-like domains protein 11, partial [Dufourea novaeangliae]
SYTVTSMERYTQPVTVNAFTWCLQIPPRCPTTRTEMRQRYRKKTESKTRSVNECCEGYQTVPSNDEEIGIKCVPFCENCLSGICVSPNVCECSPGYEGNDCATVCTRGTWGSQCKEKCDCVEDVACDPVNGHCLCPPGSRGRRDKSIKSVLTTPSKELCNRKILAFALLIEKKKTGKRLLLSQLSATTFIDFDTHQGLCNESCPEDRWGPECVFPCDCGDTAGKCDPESGRCVVNETVNARQEINQAMNVAITEEDERSSTILGTTEATLEVSHEAPATSDNPSETASPGTTVASIPDQPKTRAQSREYGNSSTVRPVIVLVSVPERRRNLENDRGKFPMKNPFLRHVDDLHGLSSPKTDYVKNIHKDEVHQFPIPLDIALIVIASIVSLGLTSVTVVLVLHMRSKLFETARLSIYELEKMKSQENTGTVDRRISSIVTSALPQTPVRMSTSFFASTPETGTMLTIPNIDPSSNYANGAATIGLRISGSLRDFLQEDHYDRPPATRIHLQTNFDANTEHVYDEIPLQSSPLCFRKNA